MLNSLRRCKTAQGVLLFVHLNNRQARRRDEGDFGQFSAHFNSSFADELRRVNKQQTLNVEVTNDAVDWSCIRCSSSPMDAETKKRSTNYDYLIFNNISPLGRQFISIVAQNQTASETKTKS